jgi:hypothetical protein
MAQTDLARFVISMAATDRGIDLSGFSQIHLQSVYAELRQTGGFGGGTPADGANAYLDAVTRPSGN